MYGILKGVNKNEWKKRNKERCRGVGVIVNRMVVEALLDQVVFD